MFQVFRYVDRSNNMEWAEFSMEDFSDQCGGQPSRDTQLLDSEKRHSAAWSGFSVVDGDFFSFSMYSELHSPHFPTGHSLSL